MEQLDKEKQKLADEMVGVQAELERTVRGLSFDRKLAPQSSTASSQ